MLNVKVELLSTSRLNASCSYNLLYFIYARKASRIHVRELCKILIRDSEIHLYLLHYSLRFFFIEDVGRNSKGSWTARLIFATAYGNCYEVRKKLHLINEIFLQREALTVAEILMIFKSCLCPKRENQNATYVNIPGKTSWR